MSHLILRVEYDGTKFCGWQMQPNAPTVEGALRKTIQTIYGEDVPLIGAGRTDTGVHARGQVASADLPKLKVPADRLLKAFNSYLPKNIRINGLSIVDEKFHARFDAIAREYSFTILDRESVFFDKYAMFIKYPYCKQALMESASLFLGKHDFTTFSKLNLSTKKYVCTIHECEWTELDKNTMRLKIKADRFVYGMVRSLVGVMLEISRGRRSNEEVALALELKDRKLISPLALANGLILEKIYYKEELGNTFQIEQ